MRVDQKLKGWFSLVSACCGVFSARVDGERVKVDILRDTAESQVVRSFGSPPADIEDPQVILLLVRLPLGRRGLALCLYRAGLDLLAAEADLSARDDFEEDPNVAELILYLLLIGGGQAELVEGFLGL